MEVLQSSRLEVYFEGSHHKWRKKIAKVACGKGELLLRLFVLKLAKRTS
jgi:hypothetical protein